MRKFFTKTKKIICAVSDIRDGNLTFINLKNVSQNRKRFLNKLNLKIDNLVTSYQSHGNRVKIVTSNDCGRGAIEKNWLIGYDALITRDADVILGITVADCQPVFIYDSKKKVIAALHVSWRCLVKGLVEKTVSVFKKKFKSNFNDCQVVIGPHIQKCCFEVQNDVWKKFKNYNDYRFQKNNRKFIDLSGITKDKLIKAGFNSRKIFVDKNCTCCNKKYFSHRREQEKRDGGMLGVICLK